jgi:hypothetical protein
MLSESLLVAKIMPMLISMCDEEPPGAVQARRHRHPDKRIAICLNGKLLLVEHAYSTLRYRWNSVSASPYR